MTTLHPSHRRATPGLGRPSVGGRVRAASDADGHQRDGAGSSKPICLPYICSARSTRPASARPSCSAIRSAHAFHSRLPRIWIAIGLRSRPSGSGEGFGFAFGLATSFTSVMSIGSPQPLAGTDFEYPTYHVRWTGPFLDPLLTFYAAMPFRAMTRSRNALDPVMTVAYYGFIETTATSHRSQPMHATLRPAPVDIDGLTTTLVDRILNVQRQYKRETGRKLSHADAFDEVMRRAKVGAPVDGDAGFTARELEPVACHLASIGYSPQAIDGALADIGREGTARDSGHVNPEDRDAVEELIPERSMR